MDWKRLFLIGLSVCVCCREDVKPSHLDDAWLLPFDLIEKLPQLEELQLPPTVDRFDWLSRSRLKGLSIPSGPGLKSLEGLPRGLSRLELNHAPVETLLGLPASVKNLDIRWTYIDDPTGLPKSLEILKMNGNAAPYVRTLPEFLQELTLAEVRAPVVQGFPPNLRDLNLSGAGGIESIEGLPSTLKSLRLQGTALRELPALPSSLQKLELADNSNLHIDSLPESLLHLVLENQSVPGLDRLQYLDALEIGGEVFLSAPLPGLLTRFRVTGPRVPFPSLLPLSLKDLGLINRSDSLLSLPPELIALELTRYTGTVLISLPATLKVLRLHAPPGKISNADLCVPGLNRQGLFPESLVELQLQSCDLTGIRFPGRLTHLDVRGSKGLAGHLPGSLQVLIAAETDISSLHGLPAQLRNLDISNTQIRSLAGLPNSLEELTLNIDQVRTLAGLPSSVRVLRFVERSLTPRGTP